MSEKESSKNSGEALPDLSALNFGPAWARDKPSGTPSKKQGSRGERRDNRQDGGDRKSGGREQRGGNQRDRRQGGGRRESSGGREYRGRRDSSQGQGARGDYNRKQVTPAPEGITARIMPIEEGLDALAKDIVATGRTHSVFDIAWMVLSELERFHVVFESEDQTLYRSKKDHSLWLYQKECMAHFWAKGVVNQYYDEEIVEVDAPKGNFQSVARCGLSGALIGPPNHHAYQKNLLDIYREKFSNMPLDRYKAKVKMEHSEEVVAEWMESMKKHVRWRPKSEAVETVETSAEKAEELADETTVLEVASGSPNEAVDSAEGDSTPVVAVLPEIEEAVVILDSHLEVEKHFLSHGFDEEFEVGKVLSVLANVPTKMIDPGLFTLLKSTVIDERRYPGKLASILCRQMSGRHLAVFKWKKHLHCGPARPRQVSENVSMAERPSQLFRWVIENPGGKIDAMWEALLAKDVDDDTRHLWYHDLHWLINEGIVLLFSDGKLHAAKEQQKKKPAEKKKPKVKKKAQAKKADVEEVSEAKDKTDGVKPAEESSKEEKPAEVKPKDEKLEEEKPVSEIPENKAE